MFWFFGTIKCLKIKKESGENPERSGHCNWCAISHHATGNYRWEGGRKQNTISQETCQDIFAIINLPGKG